jgi:hypothetical protein
VTLVPRRRKEKCWKKGRCVQDAVLLKVRRNHDFRLRGKLPEGVTRELGRIIENLIQQHAVQKTRQDKTRQVKTRQDKSSQVKSSQVKSSQVKTSQDKTRQDKTTENDELCTRMFYIHALKNIYTYEVNQEMCNDKISLIISSQSLY